MLLIKKIFDYFIWVMFFGLLLLGGIIYVSNRTYPGNKLYPLKLKFEDFVLATSKVLNKQVDFSIDLVSRRSNEIAKILTPKNSVETLTRLDTQVESTAISISQISDPFEKKKAAEKYIVKLNEVSSVLSEKQKEFIVPPPIQQTQPPPDQLTVSEPISQEINNSQQTIDQTIDEMNKIANQPIQNVISTPTSTPQPTNIPTPTDISNNGDSQNNSIQEDSPAPTSTPSQPIIQESSFMPTDIPKDNNKIKNDDEKKD